MFISPARATASWPQGALLTQAAVLVRAMYDLAALEFAVLPVRRAAVGLNEGRALPEYGSVDEVRALLVLGNFLL